MPITIFEVSSSRKTKTGKGPTAVVNYFVSGTDDEREVRLAVLAFSPSTYEGVLVLLSTSQEHMGGGVWSATAEYGTGEQQSSADPSEGGNGGAGGGGGGGNSNDGHNPGEASPIGPHVSVSIRSRQEHITQALFTTTSQNAGETRPDPDNKGAIGVDRNGVSGCDIDVPEITWTETWTFNPDFITFGYVRRLAYMHGRVNSEKFRGFEAGEVKFLGADIPELDDMGRQKVTFHFHAEFNNAECQLSESLVVNKEGHDYLEVEYEPDASDEVNLGVKIRAARVHVVGRPDASLSYGSMIMTTWHNKVSFLHLGIGGQ